MNGIDKGNGVETESPKFTPEALDELSDKIADISIILRSLGLLVPEIPYGDSLDEVCPRNTAIALTERAHTLAGECLTMFER